MTLVWSTSKQAIMDSALKAGSPFSSPDRRYPSGPEYLGLRNLLRRFRRKRGFATFQEVLNTHQNWWVVRRYLVVKNSFDNERSQELKRLLKVAGLNAPTPSSTQVQPEREDSKIILEAPLQRHYPCEVVDLMERLQLEVISLSEANTLLSSQLKAEKKSSDDLKIAVAEKSMMLESARRSSSRTAAQAGLDKYVGAQSSRTFQDKSETFNVLTAMYSASHLTMRMIPTIRTWIKSKRVKGSYKEPAVMLDNIVAEIDRSEKQFKTVDLMLNRFFELEILEKDWKVDQLLQKYFEAVEKLRHLSGDKLFGTNL